MSQIARSACTAMMQPVSERPNDAPSDFALGISAQRMSRSMFGLMYLWAELAGHLQVHARDTFWIYLPSAEPGTLHGQRRLAPRQCSDDAGPHQGNRQGEAKGEHSCDRSACTSSDLDVRRDGAIHGREVGSTLAVERLLNLGRCSGSGGAV